MSRIARRLLRGRPAPGGERGFSLIELMVSIVIGLVVVLAVTKVITVSESRKRTTTSTNDINLTGAYTLDALDNAVRSAGTGFAQSSATSFGCPLNASSAQSSVKQILPVSGSLPAPFDTMVAALGAFRMAPLIIAKGRSSYPPTANNTASDVLIVMSGSAGYGEVPVPMLAAPQSANLTLYNTISFQKNDVLLVTDQAGTAMAPCMIEQVQSTFPGGGAATALPLGGNLYTATGANQSLTSYSINASVVNLGQTPSLMLYGVGANTSLYGFDLLHGFDPPQNGSADVVSDGVIDMRALYYVDPTVSGLPTPWISPVAGSGYADTELLTGSASAITKLKSIKAVRIGLILRSALQDTQAAQGTAAAPTASTLTMFSDLGPTFTYTRTLSADDQKYRYRVFESTIPLRNSYY